MLTRNDFSISRSEFEMVLVVLASQTTERAAGKAESPRAVKRLLLRSWNGVCMVSLFGGQGSGGCPRRWNLMMSVFAKLQLKFPRPPRDEVVEHRSYDGGDLAKHGINGRQRQREDILEVPTSLLVS